MAILIPAQHLYAREDKMVVPSPGIWDWIRIYCRRLIWLAVLLSVLEAKKVNGQAVSHEYALKSVFLLNFAQFTDWPTNTFAGADEPFVMGILGGDPFGALLDETVRNEQVNGRKIVVKRFFHVEDIKTCHLLFISQSELRRLDKILADLKGRPVLTVSEIENSAYRGVCVRFTTDNNKIRLRINTDSLKAANLKMSSQLLRLAEIVPSGNK